ncbi:MAG TPA: rod shape-determining protein MreD [Planctomycetaceae bacterium]|jgi:rod shape-determining protein MreD|nr:rod shape-determining protein MreD [Planctomycetaceae bacterium]
MKLFLAVMFTALLLLAEPLVDQAFADLAFRPNLRLAPLAIWISLCPGALAVVGCGLIGLIVDCLSGSQLGARAACFCMLAAVASITVTRRDDSQFRRIATWGAVLFAAEMFSRIIACSSTDVTFHPGAAAFEAGQSALTTTLSLSGLWLASEIVSRGPHAARSFRRLAPAIGRSRSGD